MLFSSDAWNVSNVQKKMKYGNYYYYNYYYKITIFGVGRHDLVSTNLGLF